MIALLAGAAARSLALGLIVWLALTLLRLHNVHVRKTVWTVVLGASLAMPLLMCAAPPVPIHAPLRALASQFVLTLGASGARTMPAGLATAGLAVGLLYLTVASLLAYRFARGLLAMWRVRREARAPVPPESSVLRPCWTHGLDVRSSPLVCSPATFASTILLPDRFGGWSEHKLAAVLAHERSHVTERDCYVLWLARIHCCLMWFNPLAWWLLRQLSQLAEATSDDAALEALEDPGRYAEILLELAGERSAMAAAVAMARPATVSARIERVLSGIAPAPRPTLRRRALAAAIVLPVIAAAAIPVIPAHAAPRIHAIAASDDGSRAGSASQAGTAPADAAGSQQAARVLSWPRPADLRKYYPAAARRKGIDGLVRIAVTLDREGRATDTHILSEAPPDLGFGAAASSLAHLMRYGNPTGQRTQIVFEVKFALSGDGAKAHRHHASHSSASGE